MHRFLSHEINKDSPMYGGGAGFFLKKTSSIQKGDIANTQKWEIPNHLGTHIDLPYHFYENGQTIKDFPDDYWVINGEKIQILQANIDEKGLLIKPENIQKTKINTNAELVIIKTGYENHRNEIQYWEKNPGLSLDLPNWIREHFKKIRILGIDTISVSSFQHRDVGRQVHKKMLEPEKPILLIEDMKLTEVDNNTIFKSIIIAPIRVTESDGLPVTIVAEIE